MPDAETLIPRITDVDIDWVCSLLGLDTFDESRREFLKRRTTVDVSACPGSGKTTLVVAKLAILARKWPHRTKGVCVLSHTNVAREQIEHRLGRTVVGQRLLGYPHFIDTIHGFLNRFLALPWLYSNGYPSPTIDNDVTTAYRRGTLGQDYHIVQAFLSKKYRDFEQLRICGRDLSFDLVGKAFPAKATASSFQHAKRAIEAAARAGYFCHEEMFVWAEALLEDQEDMSGWIAQRFPLVILDEMQDTFERQACFLNSVFPRKSAAIVVQRVGDPNQEVFDLPDSGTDTAEPFPDTERGSCLVISNSYRFGAKIAALASPFAVHPVGTTGLRGLGPKEKDSETDEFHAIFIFPDATTDGVLEAYGKYALSVLGEDFARTGLVTAVGHIHQEDVGVQSGHAHYPKTVGHYWNGYSAEISRKDPYPRTLAQYLRVARHLVRNDRVLSPGVEKIAFGVLELARRLGATSDFRQRARSHRTIVEALRADSTVLGAYQEILRVVLVDRSPISEDDWSFYQKQITEVASALCKGEIDSSKGKSFLVWPSDERFLSTEGDSLSSADLNTYCVRDGRKRIDIRLGSIHSVKGQTHLATLLLSTYWYGHSAKRLLPWLVGDKINGKDTGKQDKQRLLHTYVAMTRPSHLLCLAIPRSVVGQDAYERNVSALRSKGWRVADIVDAAAQWQD